MALFWKKEKKEETNPSVKVNDSTSGSSVSGARVKVLGSGCAKCNQLEQATKAALVELGMDTDIEHVTDFAMIAQYGVMTTPAIVMDNKVLSYGKVLKTDEVVKLIREHLA